MAICLLTRLEVPVRVLLGSSAIKKKKKHLSVAQTVGFRAATFGHRVRIPTPAAFTFLCMYPYLSVRVASRFSRLFADLCRWCSGTGLDLNGLTSDWFWILNGNKCYRSMGFRVFGLSDQNVFSLNPEVSVLISLVIRNRIGLDRVTAIRAKPV